MHTGHGSPGQEVPSNRVGGGAVSGTGLLSLMGWWQHSDRDSRGTAALKTGGVCTLCVSQSSKCVGAFCFCR